jgi:hypothetical protein
MLFLQYELLFVSYGQELGFLLCLNETTGGKITELMRRQAARVLALCDHDPFRCFHIDINHRYNTTIIHSLPFFKGKRKKKVASESIPTAFFTSGPLALEPGTHTNFSAHRFVFKNQLSSLHTQRFLFGIARSAANATLCPLVHFSYEWNG